MWIRSESEEVLVEDIAALAPYLGINQNEFKNDRQIAKAVAVKLRVSEKPWLLVFDNAPSSIDVRTWLTSGVHVIATTRKAGWAGFDEYQVSSLSTKQAVQLLIQETSRTISTLTDAKAAMRLTHALDRLPLALVLAGAWLRDSPRASFGDYESRIERVIFDAPKTLGIEDYLSLIHI